jgi:hypothetical protein
MKTLSLLLFLLTTSIIAFAQDPVKGEAVTFVSAQQLLSQIREAPPQIPGFSWLNYVDTNASEAEVVRRTTPGKAELHRVAVDIWYVVNGSGTLVTSGTLTGKIENAPREVNWDTSSDGASELRGTGILGGEERQVAKGNFVVIPAETPHWLRKIEGEIIYLVIKVPPPNTAARSASGSAVSSWSARDHLIGTWRLVSAENVRPDGSTQPFPEYGPHPTGYLMYDSTSHMCVTLANPNPPHWTDPAKPTDAERALTHKGMGAYCGTYEVREKEGQVIHRPELAEWPHYIGSEQVRDFRLEGNRLILSAEEKRPGGERSQYKITWERVSPEPQHNKSSEETKQ